MLFSSAFLTAVQFEMEEAQGQCFVYKRRVGIPLWSWFVSEIPSKRTWAFYPMLNPRRFSTYHKLPVCLCAIGLSHLI